MPQRLTQEDFLDKCRSVHGERYDYSQVAYVSAKKKIRIRCAEHGFWETQAHAHSAGHRCPACGSERSNAAKRSSQEEFLRRARDSHGDVYDYTGTVYTDSQLLVTIKCPVHGPFRQKASAHMGGKGCSKCGLARSTGALRGRTLNREEYFRACREAHNGRYEYPEQAYRGTAAKISVLCPLHGPFEIDAGPHLRLRTGCQQCGYGATANAKKRSVESWLEEAGRIHGDKYAYDTSAWDGVGSTVRILCAKHGWLPQRAEKHSRGQGCPQCAVERLTGRWKPETLTPEYAAEPCVFYYLHFTSADESFYKVGISSKLQRRLYVLRKSGYIVRVVHQIPGSRKGCLELEIQTFVDFDAVAAYVPQKSFQGDGECFAWDVLGLDQAVPNANAGKA